jgi:hypothetical protein
MPLYRIWFAAGSLGLTVGFVFVLVWIWAGATKGRSNYYQG